MPSATATMESWTKDGKGKVVPVSTTATVTHNNARLFYYTDGQCYEFSRLDASGNRIYKDTRPIPPQNAK